MVVIGSKKCKQGYGGVSLESVSQFYVGASGFSCCASHLIYFIKKIYKYCTFNVIYNDNSAISCVTLQHKKGLYLSTLTHLAMLVILYFMRSSPTYQRRHQ
jgi:hypothetical protein